MAASDAESMSIRDLLAMATPEERMAFPRYHGKDGVEQFCRALVEESGILFLPSTICQSALGDTPKDRFRLGIGRKDLEAELDAFQDHMDRHLG